jgi:hypothetical protein
MGAAAEPGAFSGMLGTALEALGAPRRGLWSAINSSMGLQGDSASPLIQALTGMAPDDWRSRTLALSAEMLTDPLNLAFMPAARMGGMAVGGMMDDAARAGLVSKADEAIAAFSPQAAMANQESQALSGIGSAAAQQAQENALALQAMMGAPKPPAAMQGMEAFPGFTSMESLRGAMAPGAQNARLTQRSADQLGEMAQSTAIDPTRLPGAQAFMPGEFPMPYVKGNAMTDRLDRLYRGGQEAGSMPIADFRQQQFLAPNREALLNAQMGAAESAVGIPAARRAMLSQMEGMPTPFMGQQNPYLPFGPGRMSGSLDATPEDILQFIASRQGQLGGVSDQMRKLMADRSLAETQEFVSPLEQAIMQGIGWGMPLGVAAGAEFNRAR